MEVWGHRVWRGNGSTKWQSRGGMVGVVPELGAGKEEVRGTKYEVRSSKAGEWRVG